MAFDGAILHCVKKELEDKILNSKVDKVYQPSKDEIVLTFRAKKDSFKLLISTRANSARVHITNADIINPKTPPMLCMLLRKKLIGANLVNIRQIDLERALFLDFDVTDEIFQKQKLTLIVEIMGKYSNAILVDEKNKIICALKNVTHEMSSKREIRPSRKYTFPPKQDKLNFLTLETENSNESIWSTLFSLNQEKKLSYKDIQAKVQGLSSIVCKEISQKLEFENTDFKKSLSDLANVLKNGEEKPYAILNGKGDLIDFTFFKLNYLKSGETLKEYESFSLMLDEFYSEKDRKDRFKSQNQFLIKNLNNSYFRLSKKLKLLKKELEQSRKKDNIKIKADLLNANIYKIKKGIKEIELDNFYSEKKEKIKINLDPGKSPSDNIQKYYKKYKKAKNAEEALTEQISKAQSEIDYLNSVLYELENLNSENELLEIKTELINSGYLKEHSKAKKTSRTNTKTNEKEAFLKFETNNFTILVGKNNLQNHKLTLKTAKKGDIWFHVKDCPGSHTVILTNGKEPDFETLMFAAQIAAFFSKAKNSSQVPVDYTQIKNVKKPNGAKPGMVIYENYKTLFVTPKSP